MTSTPSATFPLGTLAAIPASIRHPLLEAHLRCYGPSSLSSASMHELSKFRNGSNNQRLKWRPCIVMSSDSKNPYVVLLTHFSDPHLAKGYTPLEEMPVGSLKRTLAIPLTGDDSKFDSEEIYAPWTNTPQRRRKYIIGYPIRAPNNLQLWNKQGWKLDKREYGRLVKKCWRGVRELEGDVESGEGGKEVGEEWESPSGRLGRSITRSPLANRLRSPSGSRASTPSCYSPSPSPSPLHPGLEGRLRSPSPAPSFDGFGMDIDSGYSSLEHSRSPSPSLWPELACRVHSPARPNYPYSRSRHRSPSLTPRRASPPRRDLKSLAPFTPNLNTRYTSPSRPPSHRDGSRPPPYSKNRGRQPGRRSRSPVSRLVSPNRYPVTPNAAHGYRYGGHGNGPSHYSPSPPPRARRRGRGCGRLQDRLQSPSPSPSITGSRAGSWTRSHSPSPSPARGRRRGKARPGDGYHSPDLSRSRSRPRNRRGRSPSFTPRQNYDGRGKFSAGRCNSPSPLRSGFNSPSPSPTPSLIRGAQKLPPCIPQAAAYRNHYRNRSSPQPPPFISFPNRIPSPTPSTPSSPSQRESQPPSPSPTPRQPQPQPQSQLQCRPMSPSPTRGRNLKSLVAPTGSNLNPRYTSPQSRPNYGRYTSPSPANGRKKNGRSRSPYRPAGSGANRYPLGPTPRYTCSPPPPPSGPAPRGRTRSRRGRRQRRRGSGSGSGSVQSRVQSPSHPSSFSRPCSPSPLRGSFTAQNARAPGRRPRSRSRPSRNGYSNIHRPQTPSLNLGGSGRHSRSRSRST